MRTLLLAALSLSALTPSRDADACGGYRPEPRVLQLTSHWQRTFVIYGDATPSAKLAWRQIAPMTYDPTEIADAEPLANPVTFTLVGAKGTRVVSSTKHVFLSKSWHFDKPQFAIEIGDVRGFEVAIEGTHEDASWLALEEQPYKLAAARRWVTALGVTPYDTSSAYVNRIAGTKFETVTVFPKDGKRVTFLRHGDRNLGRYRGDAVGAVQIGGVMNLVIADGGQTRQVFMSTAGL